MHSKVALVDRRQSQTSSGTDEHITLRSSFQTGGCKTVGLQPPKCSPQADAHQAAVPCSRLRLSKQLAGASNIPMYCACINKLETSELWVHIQLSRSVSVTVRQEMSVHFQHAVTDVRHRNVVLARPPCDDSSRGANGLLWLSCMIHSCDKLQKQKRTFGGS